MPALFLTTCPLLNPTFPSPFLPCRFCAKVSIDTSSIQYESGGWVVVGRICNFMACCRLAGRPATLTSAYPACALIHPPTFPTLSVTCHPISHAEPHTQPYHLRTPITHSPRCTPRRIRSIHADVMMSEMFGSGYAIACCMSAMRVGKDMQVRQAAHIWGLLRSCLRC